MTITEEAPAPSTAADDDKDDPAEAIVATDGALAAIQDALTTYPDGIITELDREGDSYEIDLISGEDHLNLRVDARGKVTEEGRDNDDDDDHTQAAAATVTAVQAAQEALNQQPEGVIDSLSLDEEDGNLVWEIDLDDAEGNDLAELKSPAV